jgi:predicted lipoprotein with Yx(FWY)xxD motif
MKKVLMTTTIFSYLLMTSLVSLVIITSCTKDKNENNASTPPKEVSLKNHPTLGNILVDKEDRTLYFFSNDANGQSSCTGGCETMWQVFNIDNLTQEKLGDGLSVDGFGSITTASGKKQLTYKGYPLYYFAPGGQKEGPGHTGGEGSNDVWFVAKPDYTIMISNAQLVGNDGKNYQSNYAEGVGKTIYFTDGKGLTLYTFTKDSANNNNFTKPDFSNNTVWPIYETDKVVVPSTLDKALFGSIDIFGKKQLIYKGWPLYYFGADGLTRGNNKGVSVIMPGVWRVPVKNMTAAPVP